MKKLLSFMLILVFTVSTLGFAGVTTQNKIVTKTGIIVVAKNSISLKISNSVLLLTGQTKGLLKYSQKKVNVNGYMHNKKFVVKDFTLAPKNTVTPTPSKTPIVTKQNPTSIIGVIAESNLEGIHYEITTKTGKYILVGLKNEELSKFLGKPVKIFGKVSENQVSIYQSGTLFNVTNITPTLEQTTIPAIDFGKTKVKTIVLIGTIVIDEVKGAHFGLYIGDKLYGLSGNNKGLEKFSGKKVKVVGYIPDIKYIRAPDYIMFDVISFSEVK
jgi:hypothetical protein